MLARYNRTPIKRNFFKFLSRDMVSAQKPTALLDQVPKEPQKLKDNIAVWSEMKDLVVKYKGLSLGEGAPAW